MVGSSYPKGWHEYVRAHHRSTVGFVVAKSGICLDIQGQEATGSLTRVPGRSFRPIHPSELRRLALPRSWFMGIILCQGDDLDAIVHWIQALRKADRPRIVLYIHPDFDQEEGARILRQADLEDLRSTEFRGSWTNFHQTYGSDHSWQVWEDREA